MIDLLRELCEAAGVSGEEGEIRDLILRHIRDHVEDIRIDPMGNVLAVKRGTGQVALRVMAAAHMDEVGLMVMGFDSDGTLRFKEVGGLDARILPGMRVLIGPEKVPGVVSWVPVHLNQAEETVPVDRLRIDIGANNKDAAQNGIERGDRTLRIAVDRQAHELGLAAEGVVQRRAPDADRALQRVDAGRAETTVPQRLHRGVDGLVGIESAWSRHR